MQGKQNPRLSKETGASSFILPDSELVQRPRAWTPGSHRGGSFLCLCMREGGGPVLSMCVSAILWPPVRSLSDGTFLNGDRVLKTANRTVDFFPFRVLYPSHTRPNMAQKNHVCRVRGNRCSVI